MQVSLFLAQFLGSLFIIVAASMLIQRQKMLEIMESFISSHASLFIIEVLSIAAGLALVINHNVWTGSTAEIIITLLGWIFIIRGIVGMFLSYLTMHTIFRSFRKSEAGYYAASLLVLLLGLYLAFAAI